MENIGFCRLGGFVHSHPEIMGSYPPLELTLTDDDKKSFLRKSLPDGIEPGSYHHDKLGDNFILSYVFAMKNENINARDDLASITAVVSEKNVKLNDFKVLFREVIDSFKDKMEKFDPLTFSMLLERIYNGVNENKRIKISEVIVDIPGIIENNKLALVKKEVTQLKGSFF